MVDIFNHVQGEVVGSTSVEAMVKQIGLYRYISLTDSQTLLQELSASQETRDVLALEGLKERIASTARVIASLVNTYTTNQNPGERFHEVRGVRERDQWMMDNNIINIKNIYSVTQAEVDELLRLLKQYEDLYKGI